jgi:hypothetical protein
MKVIHTNHTFKKLSTLKHSCFHAHFTLKHSCIYAETLLPTIYTYIYLYKRTCSWSTKFVDNSSLKERLINRSYVLAKTFKTSTSKSHSYNCMQNLEMHLIRSTYRDSQPLQVNRLTPTCFNLSTAYPDHFLNAFQVQEKPFTIQHNLNY